ncbi:hypothetical protein AADG42_19015 [Ammonicoccus fulvus]|uniref:Uncharacterized protein n=1 Tax=Ammonicoccus fulvus TaxID=3138240 RepID=A0ABZ3FVX1_9ACTN
MNNEYLHLQLHNHQIHEAYARADEARHAAELPKPERARRLPGLILDFFSPRRPKLSVRRATMTA